MSDQVLGKKRGDKQPLPPLSMKGRIIAIAAVLLFAGGMSFLNSSGHEDRLERDAEVLALMKNYSADEVSIYDGGWSGSDGSVPGRYTLHVTKDGSTHSCHQVTVESLRAQEPIKCKGGAVIAPKEVRAAEEH